MNEEYLSNHALSLIGALYFLFNYTNLDFQDIILFYHSMYKIKSQY